MSDLIPLLVKDSGSSLSRSRDRAAA